ncbi:alpha/beta hydrolase [Pelosinus sp. sgz500959]|uniref:alpha/beta hydrolase n=1 Tax=Pelosinus sp. sgz500959 TaxID=3242472 RepID=UPI0036701C44
MKKIYFNWYMLLFFSLVIFNTTVGWANPQESNQLSSGAGMFTMSETTGVNNDNLRVFYYRPSTWTPEKEIVIVLHGVQRNAEEYRNQWEKYADTYNLLVICPDFSADKYPGVGYYNVGNMMNTDNENGIVQSREKWIFPVIDRVFDEVHARVSATTDTYTLFGHSAGAQFVHRYFLFSLESKAKKIISANAGWYTMPDREAPFPYGLKNIAITNEDLAKAFAKPVTILLGENDVKTGGVLRHTELADGQGINRFERGNNFFAMAKDKAEALGVPFNWKLITVPGVGHSDGGMAAAAAKLIASGEE